MFDSIKISRREALQLSAAGVVGYSMSGWLEVAAQQAANNPQRRRSCILLWMNGGPSQMDTFDLKPGHVNGGPYRETQTNVPGIRISEHLPRVARHMDKMALIRAMSTREGDHGRGTFYLRTGYLPQGPIQYPTLGSLVSKEIGATDLPLPSFVSIAPYRLFNQAAFSSGFLGPQYAPLMVGEVTNFAFNQQGGQNNYDQALQVQDMRPPEGISARQFDARVNILQDMERDFTQRHQAVAARSHQTAYERAVRLMRTSARTAFDLTEEPAALRQAYGTNLFGQGCLLARRLVERNVPFVEVTLGPMPGSPIGWDTHGQNFQNVQRLSQILDPAWGTLMEDLRQRNLLETTTIVWMGEFGRTPRINGGQGRDHYPNAWTTVLAGGGIRGGTVYGRTSPDGTTVEDPGPVSVPDFLATLFAALGIDHTNQNMSNVGRPIPITERVARPIREVLA
ncbi:MAG: DUF1501 domain-containing protein [Planctomycetes bacterium]|jgi:uncharacterized protein (DUF1501 family)|nr:DUF1501 domain-containing protein [Planctomycetota bacterium]